MDLQLEGRVAIVTGGSEGIGRATAALLAAEGAKVAVCARRDDVLQEAAAAIRASTGQDILAISGDVTSAEDMQHLVAEVTAKLGQPCILVNNAGTSAAGPFETVDDDAWGADLNLKLLGAARLSRLLVPGMRESGGGSIVNVTAVAGKHPGANSLPTSVSRAAGIALTKAMSKDLAGDNIRVNAVCIGLIKSGQIGRSLARRFPGEPEDVAYAKMGADLPMKRIGEAEEAANVIAFLVSDAASYVTGVAVNIDGGTSSSV